MQGTKKVINLRWERFKRDFKMIWIRISEFLIKIFKENKKVNVEFREHKIVNKKRKAKSKY